RGEKPESQQVDLPLVLGEEAFAEAEEQPKAEKRRQREPDDEPPLHARRRRHWHLGSIGSVPRFVLRTSVIAVSSTVRSGDISANRQCGRSADSARLCG